MRRRAYAVATHEPPDPELRRSQRSRAGKTPPRDGQTATIAAGETWTYQIETVQAIAPPSCTQFTFNNLDPNRSYHITAKLDVKDGNAANNSLDWTGTMKTLSV